MKRDKLNTFSVIEISVLIKCKSAQIVQVLGVKSRISAIIQKPIFSYTIQAGSSTLKSRNTLRASEILLIF